MTQLFWLFKWPLLKQNFCKWRDFHAYYFELLQEINFRAQKAIFYNGHKELQNVFYPLSLLHLKAFNPDQPLLDIFLILLLRWFHWLQGRLEHNLFTTCRNRHIYRKKKDWTQGLLYKAELLQLNRTQFPSLGLFVSKKVGNWKN